jgi:hypothetical protein
MNILICNVGSTSLKYQLFDMDRGEAVLCAGGAERVGAAKSLYYHTDNRTGTTVRMDAVFPTHREAIEAMISNLLDGCIESLDDISCVACTGTIVLGISLIAYALNRPILSLYIADNPTAIDYGIIRMTYMTLPYFLLGLMDISTAALRGLGYSFISMIISLTGACFLRILWIHTVFTIPKYHTLPCLYIIYPISWFLTFAVSSVLFMFLCNKKQRSENPLPQRSIA